MGENTGPQTEQKTDITPQRNWARITGPAVACIMSVALFAIGTMKQGVQPSTLIPPLGLISAYVITLLCLRRYKVLMSGGTVTVKTLCRKHVINPGQVRSAKWAGRYVLRITYEDQGRILNARAHCGDPRSEEGRRIRGALREAWPGLIPD